MNTKNTNRRVRKMLGLPLAFLSALGVNACKSIHTELPISAPPEEVWQVITDTERYPEWNPYHVQVRGQLREGETIQVEIEKPNGNHVSLEPEVLRVRENQELTWGGGITGLFTGEHVFEILPREDGVLFVHREEFRGLFVPFAELDTIEEGYHLMNQALKRRIEQDGN